MRVHEIRRADTCDWRVLNYSQPPKIEITLGEFNHNWSYRRSNLLDGDFLNAAVMRTLRAGNKKESEDLGELRSTVFFLSFENGQNERLN